jgi:hypothetical protein
MRRFLCVLMTFLFPIGIWLVLLGYELMSMLFLLTGWAAMVTLAERGER